MFCCFVILLVFRTFGSGSGGKKKKKIASFFLSYLFLCLEEKIFDNTSGIHEDFGFYQCVIVSKKMWGANLFPNLRKRHH